MRLLCVSLFEPPACNLSIARCYTPVRAKAARLGIVLALFPRVTPMNTIPDKYRDLLDRPIVVSLATLMRDGSPQVQPVWCSFDGTHILVNTEKGSPEIPQYVAPTGGDDPGDRS